MNHDNRQARWQELCNANGDRALTDDEHAEIALLQAKLSEEAWDRKQQENKR